MIRNLQRSIARRLDEIGPEDEKGWPRSPRTGGAHLHRPDRRVILGGVGYPKGRRDPDASSTRRGTSEPATPAARAAASCNPEGEPGRPEGPRAPRRAAFDVLRELARCVGPPAGTAVIRAPCPVGRQSLR